MLGTGEILVIFVVILILFGGKRLPEFAQSLGKGIREFKRACSGEEDRVVEPEKITKSDQPNSFPIDSSNDLN